MFEKPDVLASIGCAVLIALALATIYFVARERPDESAGEEPDEHI